MLLTQQCFLGAYMSTVRTPLELRILPSTVLASIRYPLESATTMEQLMVVQCN